MPTLRSKFGFFSPIAVTAMLSVLVLVSVSSYQIYRKLNPSLSVTETPPETRAEIPEEWRDELAKLGITSESLGLGPEEGDVDTTALIGPVIASQILTSYEEIRERGDYTSEDLHQAAGEIAKYMKAGVDYKKRSITDFPSDPDSSPARVKKYRDDLINAIKPLDSISTAEYIIYGKYTATGDPIYLEELAQAGELYAAVAESASSVVVPKDALIYHTDVVNSLEGFGAVLRELSEYADDPFASVALLRTYNEKEAEITRSYNGLRAYYGNKAL